MSAYITEKLSSLTPTLIPSEGVSSRFFNQLFYDIWRKILVCCLKAYGQMKAVRMWKHSQMQIEIHAKQTSKSSCPVDLACKA